MMTVGEVLAYLRQFGWDQDYDPVRDDLASRNPDEIVDFDAIESGWVSQFALELCIQSTDDQFRREFVDLLYGYGDPGDLYEAGVVLPDSRYDPRIADALARRSPAWLMGDIESAWPAHRLTPALAEAIRRKGAQR